MSDSDSTEIEKGTENQRENPTLSQRLEKLGETPIKRKPLQLITRTLLLSVSEEFCVICKLPRLNPDPTGLTCNNPKCLVELGKFFVEIKEKIEELSKSLGLKIEEVPGFFSFHEQGLDTIREQVDAIASELNTIAETLGFDQVNRPDRLTELCEMIKNEVTTLRKNIEQLEKKQKTD